MASRDRAESVRVVVTGLGAVTALGPDRQTSWEALIAGCSGVGPVARIPVDDMRTKVAAEIPGDPGSAELTIRERRRTARTDRIAIGAAVEAVRDAGVDLEGLDPAAGAVVLGAGAAGLMESEGYFRELLEHGPRRARVSRTLSYFPSSATDWVAAKLGFTGPRSTVVTACSSSAIAVGRAFDLVRSGRCSVAVTGGSDTLSLLTFAGFNSLRAMDVVPCRPFDRDRAGLTLGEGAAMMVLEPLAAARRRGARIYAELLGYGVRCDAHHMTAPQPDGDGAYRTMADALRMAAVDPSEIDYVNAHGTATPLNDRSETAAIRRLFGPHVEQVWVSSVKAAFGHCLGAAGAVEAFVLALAIHHATVPPTLGWANRDPECDIDCVPNVARGRRIRVGLSNSFAFGGNNATLVMARFDG